MGLNIPMSLNNAFFCSEDIKVLPPGLWGIHCILSLSLIYFFCLTAAQCLSTALPFLLMTWAHSFTNSGL